MTDREELAKERRNMRGWIMDRFGLYPGETEEILANIEASSWLARRDAAIRVATLKAAAVELEAETWEGPQNGEERGYNGGLRHAAAIISAGTAEDR